MSSLTPRQKLITLIIARCCELDKNLTSPCFSKMSGEDIDALADEEMGSDWWYDAVQEVRCSGMDSDVPPPLAGWYEAKSRVARVFDGSWVGWTCFYGGGKHSEPESVPWIDDAYDVDARREEVIVMRFTRKESTDANAEKG